ncbi:MAG: hypothetical protein RLZZ436_4526 [Planctomycetota bacterium]
MAATADMHRTAIGTHSGAIFCRNAGQFDPESPIPRRAILAEPGWGSSTSDKLGPGNRGWQCTNRENGPGLRKPVFLPETHALPHRLSVQPRCSSPQHLPTASEAAAATLVATAVRQRIGHVNPPHFASGQSHYTQNHRN